MREIIEGLSLVPRTCTWELTLRCNLRCGHCGSRAGVARPNELQGDAMLKVVRQLAEIGCRRVTLSGGEPTLSPHWETVAAEGARLGMKMNMITNCVNPSREFVRRAKEAGLVNLGVSLDGLEQEHDRFRGMKGLYGRVMQLLDNCAAEKLPVGAITTITRGNRHDLDELHDVLAGRIYAWQLQIGAAMGNLRDHLDEQIVPEDLLEIIPALAQLIRNKKVDIHVADNVGYYGPYESTIRRARKTPVKHWIGCFAGCRHIGIQADGGVKGCLSIQASDATEGNLQQDSLADIWRRKGAFAYNRQFKLDDLSGFCRTCEYAVVCRGGCLSMRTCEGGRENPFCYHRVATLAMQRRERRAWQYVPAAIAPAAVLAAMGIGCGGQTETVAYYGAVCPGDCTATDASVDGEASVDGDARNDTVIYGEAAPDTTEYYGFPPPDSGADADTDVVDKYGMPAPDADVVDPYGVPVPDADTDVVDKYGMPAPDAADWYGMPDPDASKD